MSRRAVPYDTMCQEPLLVFRCVGEVRAPCEAFSGVGLVEGRLLGGGPITFEICVERVK